MCYLSVLFELSTLAFEKGVMFSVEADLHSLPTVHIRIPVAFLYVEEVSVLKQECFLVGRYFQVNLSSWLLRTLVGGGGTALFFDLL